MKKFWAFYGDAFYPRPGLGDPHQSFDTLDEAKTWLIGKPGDWFQVWDVELDDCVFQVGHAAYR